MAFEGVKQVVDQAVASKEENGASLIVMKGGKEIFSHHAGLADVAEKKPFAEDTICRAYSLTKVVTSMACMMLVEEGRLDIGERLEVYMPEFEKPLFLRDGKKIDSLPIRVRDLLNMTSGIPYPGDGGEGIGATNDLWGRLDQSIRDGNSMNTQGFAKGVAKNPLLYSSGDRWMYGASADVLGALIERISGMEFGDFLEERIFRPLGMEDTAFFVPKEKRDRLAVLYENAGDEPTKVSYVNLCIYDYEENPAFQSGGAGLFSTARDYSRFADELASGGKGLISRRTVAFMRENALKDSQRRGFDWENLWGYGYGCLVRCVENRNLAGSLASVGSFGWDGWTGPYVLIDPAEELSVTLFLQRANAGTTRLARNTVNAVYADI